jgi:transcription elongation factor GreB
MSRAFVKEDQAGPPPIIPPRAALPPGTSNYVTPQGLQLLRDELSQLEKERSQVEAHYQEEADRSQQLSILNGRLSALTERLASARVVDLVNQPTDQVRFGATVTLLTKQGPQSGTTRQMTIVGVDEANLAEGRVAFVAPIARALLGAKQGQTVTLRTGRGEEVVQVLEIAYEGASDSRRTGTE